jgi:hypothetical protein
VENLLLIQIYWRNVDTFPYFGEGLTNSQKQLRKGREFTGDMLILLRIFCEGLTNSQKQLRQGRDFTGGMLILSRIWQGIGKLSSYRDHRVENLLLILIYWRNVDTFPYFGEGLKNS